MTDRVSNSGTSVRWAVIVGALVTLAPLVSTQAQDYLTNPTLYQEWVGLPEAEWNEAGSWVVWDPGEVIYDGSPPFTMPADDAELFGGRPVFSDKGGTPSVVSGPSLGANSWRVEGIWFLPAYDYDGDTDTFSVSGPANNYTITGKPLYVGAEGINNLAGIQTFETDIWAYDDMEIYGGGRMYLRGGVIHTSFSGSSREITLGGWLHIGEGVVPIDNDLVGVEPTGPVIVGDGHIVHSGDVFMFMDNEYTGQTIFRGGRVMIQSEQAFGLHDSIRVESSFAVNRISAFIRPVTLSQDFELYGNIQFGGTDSEYESGGDITVDGRFRLFGGNRAIGSEHNTNITLNGEIELDNNDLTLWGFGDSNLYVNNTIDGTGGVTLGGPNTVWLLGNNIYSGDTTLGGALVDGTTIQTGGTVVMGGNDAFGNTSNIYVEGGTILKALEPITFDAQVHFNRELTLAGDNAFTFDNAMTVGTGTPSGAGGVRLQTADPVTFTENATLALSNDFVVRGPGELVVDGVISGTGNVTAREASTVRLNAQNTFDGLLTVRDFSQVHVTENGSLAGGAEVFNNSVLRVYEGASIDGDIAVEELGTLIHGGTVGGSVTVDRRGVLHAGHPTDPENAKATDYIGTLTITGDLTLESGIPGAQVNIEFIKEDTDNDGFGESDRLIVGGTVTVQEGANFLMDQVGGRFITGGQRYFLVDATTFNILGDAEGVVTSGSPLFLRYEVDEVARANDGDLKVTAVRTPFASAAQSGNNYTLSQALDALVAEEPAGDTADMLNAFDQSVDAETFNNNLRQLSPAAYTGGVDANVQAGRTFNQEVHTQARSSRTVRQMGVGYGSASSFAQKLGPTPWAMAAAQPYLWDDTYRDRLEDRPEDSRLRRWDEAPRRDREDLRRRAIEDDRWNVFANLYGSHERIDSTDERTGLRANTGGFTVGVDYSFNENIYVGGTAGYSFTDVNFREGRGDGEIHSFRVGPYVGLTFGDLTIDASVTYGYHQNEYDQNINIGSLSQTKTSDYDAHDLSAYVNVGYEFMMPNNRTSFTPIASLSYTQYRQDSFTESGGGATNFEIESQDVDYMEGTIGVRFEHRYLTDGAAIIPNAFVGYSYEFLGDDNDVEARFVGSTSSFTLEGPDPDRHAFRVGAGVRALLSETVQGYVQYNGRFQDDQSGHAGLVGLSLQF